MIWNFYRGKNLEITSSHLNTLRIHSYHGNTSWKLAQKTADSDSQLDGNASILKPPKIPFRFLSYLFCGQPGIWCFLANMM